MLLHTTLQPHFFATYQWNILKKFKMRKLGDEIREGDVILSNHPCAGGSHLPDLTVITPVGKLVQIRGLVISDDKMNAFDLRFKEPIGGSCLFCVPTL